MRYASHPGLQWLRASDEGRAWLDGLDGVVAACAARWSLRLEEPFADAFASLVVPATTGAGAGVVLKVQFPERESEHEAEALAAWAGDGAVALLDHDVDRRALLLERCHPGSPLSDLHADDAVSVLVDLLPRLWRPDPSPFPTLAAEAERWRVTLQRLRGTGDGPDQGSHAALALRLLAELASRPTEPVLVHQDLHGDNVLRSTRGWLAIDPKPLSGEREFALAPIIRSDELGADHAAVVNRLDRLTGELGLDRWRATAWTVVQTVAWGAGPGARPAHGEILEGLVGLL